MTPAQFWRARVHYPTFSVDYFFLDNNHNDAHEGGVDQAHNMCSYDNNPDGASCGEEGPANVWECPGWFERLWQTQLPWVEDSLSQSTAEWQVVVMHFPPVWDQEVWADLSTRHGIDLIVTGHTHQ